MGDNDNRFLSATLPSGAVVHRGDAVLVEHGQIQTGHVDSIVKSGDDITVNVNVMVGEYNKTDKSKSDVEYVSGFKHVSTPYVAGAKRFMLVSEGEEAELALREHHTWAATQRGPMSEEPHVFNHPPQTPKPEVVSENPRTPAPTGTAIEGDTNADGRLSNAERKALKNK